MPSRLSSRNTPTLTIRLPDDMHERLRALARSNAISVNMLMDKRATFALANFDVRVRFETRAARGNPRRALKLLDKLDRAEQPAAVQHHRDNNPHTPSPVERAIFSVVNHTPPLASGQTCFGLFLGPGRHSTGGALGEMRMWAPRVRASFRPPNHLPRSR